MGAFTQSWKTTTLHMHGHDVQKDAILEEVIPEEVMVIGGKVLVSTSQVTPESWSPCRSYSFRWKSARVTCFDAR